MWTSVKIATAVATNSVQTPLAAIAAVVGMVSRSMAMATAVTVSTGVQLRGLSSAFIFSGFDDQSVRLVLQV